MKKGNFFTKNWLLILVVVYILSPLDILPDAIPVVGSLDDILMLALELIRRYRANKDIESTTTEVIAEKIEDKKVSLPRA